MGFWSRLKAAVKKPERQGTGLELTRWASAPPRRGTRELLLAFAESPWLRTNVAVCSDGVAGIHWRAYRRLRDGRPMKDFALRAAGHETRRPMLKGLLDANQAEEVPDHPLLQVLADPNDYLPGRDVTKVIQTHRDIVGDAFLLLERSGPQVVGFWPLAPSWVTRLPDLSLPREARTYTVNVGRVVANIPASEVIHLRAEVNPDDPLGRGVGAGFSLGDELDTDEYVSRFIKNAFFNNMLPAAVVSIEGAGALSKEQAARFKEELSREYQGADRSGRVMVTGGKTTYARLDTPFKDMQLVELRKFGHDFIRMNYRIPPEILGDITSSNKATAFAAREIFAEQVVVPRAESLRASYQKWLVPLFGDDIILDYDSPVPADREHSLNVMKAMPQAFSYTEWREVAGRRPDPNLQGYPMPLPGQKPEDAPGGEEPEQEEPDSEGPPATEEEGAKSDPPWAGQPLR